MTQTTITTEIHQTFDIHCYFTAQITFNFVVALNDLTQARNFRLGQITDTCIAVNTCSI